MANNITAERGRIGITQQDLADELGVSMKTIRVWETNIGVCKASYILAICRYFGVSADYLLGLSEERGVRDAIRNI
jgi:transcriptional regulator with XRE-family HTH domain